MKGDFSPEGDMRDLPEPPLWPQKPAHPPSMTTVLPPAQVAAQEPPKENPKAAVGRLKARQFFTPPAFRILVGAVLELGAKKYGPFNWRKDEIKASDYLDAMKRHADAWEDGEDLDPESKITHLAHVAACCAILIDAELCGALIDDREKSGQVAALLLKMQDRAGKVK